MLLTLIKLARPLKVYWAHIGPNGFLGQHSRGDAVPQKDLLLFNLSESGSSEKFLFSEFILCVLHLSDGIL